VSSFHRVDPSVICWLKVDAAFEVMDETDTDTEVEEVSDESVKPFWF
jgi:hypothetical protein